jgi:hypothetical protein
MSDGCVTSALGLDLTLTMGLPPAGAGAGDTTVSGYPAALAPQEHLFVSLAIGVHCPV